MRNLPERGDFYLEEEGNLILLCWEYRMNRWYVLRYRTILGIRRPQIPAGENEQSWGLHATPEGAQPINLHHH